MAESGADDGIFEFRAQSHHLRLLVQSISLENRASLEVILKNQMTRFNDKFQRKEI